METTAPLSNTMGDFIALFHPLVEHHNGWKTVSLVDEPLVWIEDNLAWMFLFTFVGAMLNVVFLGTLGWAGWSAYKAYNDGYMPSLFTSSD